MDPVNSAASTNALPLPSAGTAAGTTLAAFQGWPLSAQVAFINANGAGNPPQVVLGPVGSQQGLATLNGDGSIDAETLPDGFALTPDSLDEATFSSWSQDVQAAYLQTNGAAATSDGTTQSLACGSGATAFTAMRPVPAEAYDPSDLSTIQAADVQVVATAAAATPAAGFSGLFAVRRLDAASPPPPTLISSGLADLTTTGYTQADIPYENLGAAGGQYTVGTTAKTIAGTAATIYTAASSTPSPSSASPSTLTAQTFEQWTTEQQRAYITAQGGTGPITIGSGGGAIDVFVGAGGTAASPAPVYIAQNLQKTDIAKMSFKDQQTLTQAAGYPALAAAYGLMPNATTPSTGTTSALATIQALIKTYRDSITNSSVPPYVQSLLTAQIDLISSQLFGTALPAAPAAGASNYTSNLTAPTLPSSVAAQTGGSAIFSETDIQAQLDAIQTRYARLLAFANQATKNIPSCISFNYVLSDGSTGTYTMNSADDSPYEIASIANQETKIPISSLAFDQYTPDSFVQHLASQFSINVDAAGVAPAGQSSTFTQPTIGLHDFQVFMNGKFQNLVSVSNVTVTNNAPVYGGSVQPTSADNDTTIRAGYEKFVAQEAAITANKMLAANLAQSGMVAGSSQALDMPKLLCLYMMYNNNIQQAVVTADSEEVNQVNAVLQEYASMQQIINATTGTSTSNANAELNLQYGSANSQLVRLFASGQYSIGPIESLYFNNCNTNGPGWDRPRRGFYVDFANSAAGNNGNNISDTANNWTQYGTQLSDVVTQINQQSQIKMNDVNSETKQQDRYFDLASTALSKLSDTLSQIASAT